jgi:hypothetical protein
MASRTSPASIGFAVKSGWAAVVVLTGEPAAPRVASSARVELSDPDEPDQRQPYHAGFGTARANDATLARLLKAVRRYGATSVVAALRASSDAGHRIAHAGIVVGSTVDPATIANDHIRIHALEGKLFREVVADAVAGFGATCTIWRERDLYGAAARALDRSEADLKAALVELKKTTAGAWRSEQKAAALAAWMLLGARR